MDETLLQFGRAGDSGPRASEGGEERSGATACPICKQHFSPDGRFCPFDGEPLQPAPQWDPKSDALVGSIVDDRYEIVAVLGEGGMGVVYEARHRVLGKRFALKALRKELASDADIAARFMQEARTAASVSHPGLVEITDFGRLPSGQPFFVMELLAGRSLASIIRRGGPMPAARAVDIVRQIADALGAAHERSIVHRDLKPDNIHISANENGPDRVTIVDFGLAKVIGSSRLTRAGMVFGTPHYMSPEQAMGEATDHRADVYALGIVMYEMFTGRVPFEADSYMGVLTKHMYMAPTPPSRLVGTAELGVLEDIMLRCLEKKPEHRYASLRELATDLDLALHGPRSASERPSAFRRRRAVPRSLLADALELPSRDELPLWSSRDGRRRQLGGPLLVVGGLFLAGIAGVLAVQSGAIPFLGPRARVAPGSASTPKADTRSRVALVPSSASTGVTRSLPIVSSLAVSARPPLALQQPPFAAAAPLKAANAISTDSSLASSSAVPTSPTKAVASAVLASPRTLGRAHVESKPPAPPAAKKPAQIASSDIVDPWAR